MLIQKYSNSYINSSENYALIFNKQSGCTEQFRESPLYGVLCVVQNIIQRGKPSNLSNYLKSVVGDYEADHLIRLISTVPSNWSKTIKGYRADSDYPAIRFFNELVPMYLGEYSYVRNLMIPEADFDDIIGSKTAFSGQQVDFYIPLMKLVIEIDGSQHSDWFQREKDAERDEELRGHGIDVLRLNAYDIKNDTQRLQYRMEAFKKAIMNNAVLNDYRCFLTNKLQKEELRLEAISRLQLMLLSCMKEQWLKLDRETWEFYVSDADVSDLESAIQIAYTDLQLWMQPIFGMLKMNVSFPSIVFVKEKKNADLTIDFSLFKRYDDLCTPAENECIIRTDYYPEADYYQVAVSEILQYKLELEEPSEDIKRMEFLLENIFGFHSFQEGQIQVISNVLEGSDTIGILPTGAGKSLCYQFASMLQPGVSIVVDPILSLMQDQKRSMRKMSIVHNEMVSSAMSGKEKGDALEQFQSGQYQILWISPERFQDVAFRESLAVINSKLNFCLAVIDEVHCLSEWGHDFRVSYLVLVRTLKEYCPAAILLGLTATASQFVLTDIRAAFGDAAPLNAMNVKAMPSMDRKELHFERIEVNNQQNRMNIIKELLAERLNSSHPESGLLFCPTVGDWETGCRVMKDELNKEWGGQVRVFNGQMRQSEKSRNQEDYMSGDFPLMICTKAFGMGIDKPDIRYTIHNSLPASVESFYQEAGRAGRDKEDAYCYVLYQVDKRTRESFEFLLEDHFLELLDKEIIKNMSQSDLRTTLFLLSTNHTSEAEECEYIVRVLKWLGQHSIIGFSQGDPSKDNEKQKIENALYKLSLLGFVKNWTVRYITWNRGNIVVEKEDFTHITPESVLNCFQDYVRKYDIEFSLDEKKGVEYKKLLNQSKDVYNNIIQMLVKWTNDNIVHQRLQCSKTIMDWCSPEVDDWSFRHNLEGYFKFTEETILMEYIAYHPLEWEKWFDCFYDLNKERTTRLRILTREKAQENYASLQRFLESYQNNTGLNYIDGLFHFLIRKNVSQNDLKRMERSLEVIKTMPSEMQKGIIQETAIFGKQLESIEKKDYLSKLLIQYVPELAGVIFNQMQDRYSLAFVLDGMIERMEKIEWTI